ncbi:MAG TPA: hypothetical protein VHG92_14410, partial [Afifellaceae bacterium]|nr:hypothetical protein [Afifellaceae bacterium]
MSVNEQQFSSDRAADAGLWTSEGPGQSAGPGTPDVAPGVHVAQADGDLRGMPTPDVPQTGAGFAFEAVQDGIVQLPVGTVIAQFQAVGTNLHLILADGSVIVVVDALPDLPTIMIGDQIIASEEISEAFAQQAVAPNSSAIIVSIDADGMARLPEGTSLEQAQIVGTSLYFFQPDGSAVVILDALTNVPTILLGDIQIPSDTLATVLESQGIDVAAGGEGNGNGPVQSSGGNFGVPPGSIGDAFDLTALLPPTAFSLSFGEEREILEPFVPEEIEEVEPEDSPLLENTAPGVSIGFAQVSEEGLHGGNPDEIGVFDTTNLEVFFGQLSVSDPDGDPLTLSFGEPGSIISSGGEQVVWTGVGTSVLEGIADGLMVVRATIQPDGSFVIELFRPLDHPIAGVQDQLQVTFPVFVSDGTTTVETSISVTFEDDAPINNGVTLPVQTVHEDALDNLQGKGNPEGGGQTTVASFTAAQLATLV